MANAAGHLGVCAFDAPRQSGPGEGASELRQAARRSAWVAPSPATARTAFQISKLSGIDSRLTTLSELSIRG